MMHNVDAAVTEADLLVFMAEATQDSPDTLSLEQVGNRPALRVIN